MSRKRYPPPAPSSCRRQAGLRLLSTVALLCAVEPPLALAVDESASADPKVLGHSARLQARWRWRPRLVPLARPLGLVGFVTENASQWFAGLARCAGWRDQGREFLDRTLRHYRPEAQGIYHRPTV